MFADHVRELLALTAAEEASLSKLTNLILKSVSLSAKMLRLANSVQYNRSGRRILSVSHAITLLGWEAVRDLASGMHLFGDRSCYSGSFEIRYFCRVVKSCIPER